MNVEVVENLNSDDFDEEVEEVTVYECEICHQYFSNKTAFMSHNKWNHELNKILTCEKCQKKFSRSYNLTIHKNSCTGKTNIKCALCDFCGSSKSVVKDHYIGHHNQVLTQKCMEFPTFEDFNKWKENLECKTKTAFVKTSGSKRLKSGLVTFKYVCHRDGNFCSKSKGLRSLKMLGSNKINTYCPSEMSISVADNNTVTVKYIDIHLGHSNNLGRLNITQSESRSSNQELDSENVNSIVSELSTNSASFIKDKQHLLDIFLQGYNKIENREQLQAVTRQIAPINSIIDALSNKSVISLPTSSSQEPANKKIESQKFKSTKKKIKKNHDSLTNPTYQETEKMSLEMVSCNLNII